MLAFPEVKFEFITVQVSDYLGSTLHALRLTWNEAILEAYDIWQEGRNDFKCFHHSGGLVEEKHHNSYWYQLVLYFYILSSKDLTCSRSEWRIFSLWLNDNQKSQSLVFVCISLPKGSLESDESQISIDSMGGGDNYWNKTTTRPNAQFMKKQHFFSRLRKMPVNWRFQSSTETGGKTPMFV
jgi:hypothetical protein